MPPSQAAGVAWKTAAGSLVKWRPLADMRGHRYRSSIPSTATRAVGETWPDGAPKSAAYFVDGKEVGFRVWFEDGKLDYEYALQDGVKHGRWYRFYPGGQVEELQPYRRGLMHGVGKQWSPDGRLLVTWSLRDGVGLDLWCGHLSDALSEETYWPKVGEPGYNREWNDDEKTVWQEYFLLGGVGYHGIWREWNRVGRLRRGFPQFYVNDKRVTKREYIRACEADVLLVPYRGKDDSPRRELPAEYVRQKRLRR